jgi:hypothetical protein
MTNFEYYVAGRRADEGWHEFLTNYYKNKKGEDRCIDQYNKWLLEEYDPHILDDIEKKYLSNVIKPFRDSVKHIYKRRNFSGGFKYCIVIIAEDWFIELPPFDACKKMYVNMEPGQNYTLKELDI